MRAVTLALSISLLQGCWLVKKTKNQTNSGIEFEREVNPSPLGLTGELQRVESCDALVNWLRTKKLEELKHAYEEEAYWYFHRNSQPTIGRAPMPEVAADTSMSTGGVASGAEDGASTTADNSSSTNGQVNGVEEADIFKNDAEHLYMIRNNELRVVKSWPVDSMAQVGKVALKDRPFEMMLRDKQIILFSSVPGDPIEGPSTSVGQAEPAIDIESGSKPGYVTYGYTRITVVDVSTPSAPKITFEKELKGSYQTSRRSGAALRLVYHPQIKWPKDLIPYLNMWERRPANESAAKAIIDEALAKNAEALSAQDVKQWFTSGESIAANNCQDVYLPSTGAELSVVSLVTLNLDTLALQEISVLAAAHELYANQESIYLANHYYWGASGPFDYTFLHKFHAPDENSLAYVASGGVEGHLINQFAMDEHKDILRIAVTAMKDNRAPVNRVHTLQQEGSELHVIGSTPDLAQGERIFSARFIGDRGYIVTFRQTDPLFTLDLEDPTIPLVRGELKIPGVSTYLHPVGDHKLVGIGNEGGYLKLSYFDVSDISAPREINSLQFAANSEAERNHRAVADASWLNRFAIPSTSAALLLFKTDKDKGVQEAGKLVVSDLMSYRVRGYFMDDVVFALTDKGLRAAKVEDSSVTVLKTLTWE